MESPVFVNICKIRKTIILSIICDAILAKTDTKEFTVLILKKPIFDAYRRQKKLVQSWTMNQVHCVAKV
jgi:hypothetical protein